MRRLFISGLVTITILPLAANATDDISSLPLVGDIAPAAIQISPHVPHMGEHWAVPANLPGGPIYCVIDGRVVCIEYMFDQADLAEGVDWTRLDTGIETPPITHIDVEFMPDGIEPHPVPLYQLHIYFADRAALEGY